MVFFQWGFCPPLLIFRPKIHPKKHLPNGRQPARIRPVIGLQIQHPLKRNTKPTDATSSSRTVPRAGRQDDFLVLFLSWISRRAPKSNGVKYLKFREEGEWVTNTNHFERALEKLVSKP